jgi:glycerol-3-phosphate O-acyltransferase
MSTVREDQRPEASAWPVSPGEPLVFLAEASTPVEHRLIEDWVERNRPGATDAARVELIAFPHPKNDELLGIGGLQARLGGTDDPVLAPVRIAWLPGARSAEPMTRIADVLMMRDPRNPRPTEQERIIAREPHRARVLVGPPARKSELSERYRRVSGMPLDDPAEFARYVGRQAVITLEREEAHTVDERYKLPRMVKEEIVTGRRYREGVAELARELGRDESDVDEEAQDALDEMVSGRSATFIDFIIGLGRVVIRQGYEGVDYEPEQIERVRAVSRRHGIVVLPTHRSNFDALVMPIALYDNHLPRTHTLGGLNMAFWPFGPLSRRAGIIFIRRDTKDHPVYRWTLREYIGYLVEKRFGLQWYPEGTRSRTGKLLPPKLGLLVYVVDAYRAGRVDDVMLVPSSIAYDQLQEVSDFAYEVLGGEKKPEGLGWFIDNWRRMRGRYGKAYVRFSEPLSLRDALGPPGRELDPDEQHLQLQKLAFEVMWRINQVTPITGTALIALVLLSTDGRAVTQSDLRRALDDLLGEARRRKLPMTESARALETEAGVQGALQSLISSKVVTAFERGTEPVYGIGRNQHLAASFYRNSILHFFLTSSIAELALVRAGEVAPDAAVDEFWSEVQHLRDLLKFEFFFAEHDEFQALIAAELAVRDTEWQQRMEGPGGVASVLERVQPLTAHFVLRAFLESYLVVAEALEDLDPAEPVDEKPFLARCLGLGRQYLLQKRVHSPESVAKPLFRNGLDLARNQGLDAPGPDIVARRRAFSDVLRAVIARLDAVEAIALRQFLARHHHDQHRQEHV